MNPKDYKGKQVNHIPTGKSFVVTGGQKRRGEWFLKDEQGSFYLMDECQIVQVNQLALDVHALRSAMSLDDLQNIFDQVGRNRFQQAFSEIEKDSVEAATLCLLYCNNWEGLTIVCNIYKVGKEHSPELNQQFRARLKEKGLAQLVAAWYQAREGAA